MPSIIQITDLKKQYNPPDGPWAVKDVDLEIESGEVFGLLGPNGAGKTTTISMLSGLLTPSGGTAIIDGHDIAREPLAAKQIIGGVPQEIALYPGLSARQNLRFFGQLYGLGGAALTKAIDEVLEFIDLKDRANEQVEKYSGGMKRRVNIGVGLLHKPKIVFMDEPTVGIDPQAAAASWMPSSSSRTNTR
jgi:ABC-2 type transport system ATP-binding protein